MTVPFTETLTRDGNANPIGWTYYNIAGAGTYNVKSKSGVLHTIAINNPVSGSSVTIYDSATGSGTKISTIPFGTTSVATTLFLDVAFQTALTVVVVGSLDVTISYV